MSGDWFRMAYEATDILENQEKMFEYETASYPHMDKATKSKFHREAYKRGWPSTFVPKKKVSLNDVAGFLGVKNGR